jgi:hypothetical protein
MTLFKGKYRVESTRLRGWDYASAGWYFVTLCTRNRECVWGEVVNGAVRLSPMGEIVAEEWRKTEQIRANVALDEWVIMPNHVHGIIVIKNNPIVETPHVETPRRGVYVETRFAWFHNWPNQIGLHQTNLGRGVHRFQLAGALL